MSTTTERRGGRLIALVWVSLAALGGCSSSAYETQIQSWNSTSHDATILTLLVPVADTDTIRSGVVVSEDDRQVMVVAKVKRGSSADRAGTGVERAVDVKLDAPIGDRVVVNTDGSAVPELPAQAG